MGNFPLCIPKQDAIVFRDCPNNSSDFLRFRIDDLDVQESEQVEAKPGDDDGYSNEPHRANDAAVLGIELDQDSVRI